MDGNITFEISLTWAIVTVIIAVLVFIYSTKDKKGDK